DVSLLELRELVLELLDLVAQRGDDAEEYALMIDGRHDHLPVGSQSGIAVDPRGRIPAGESLRVQVDAVEQHRELRRLHLDLDALLVDDRELKSTALEPLEVDDVAVLVPEQDLEHVAALPDEDEQVALVRASLQHLLDDGAQPVDALAHVDEARRKVDAHTWWKPQHVTSPRALRRLGRTPLRRI